MRQTLEASQNAINDLQADKGALTYKDLDELGKEDPAFFDFEINSETAIDPRTGKINLPPAMRYLSVVAVSEVLPIITATPLRRAS